MLGESSRLGKGAELAGRRRLLLSLFLLLVFYFKVIKY